MMLTFKTKAQADLAIEHLDGLRCNPGCWDERELWIYRSDKEIISDLRCGGNRIHNENTKWGPRVDPTGERPEIICPPSDECEFPWQSSDTNPLDTDWIKRVHGDNWARNTKAASKNRFGSSIGRNEADMNVGI